jgi:hypothetical protein
MLDMIELDGDGRYSSEQIAKFKSDPDLYRKFIKAIEKETNNSFLVVRAYPPTLPRRRL